MATEEGVNGKLEELGEAIKAMKSGNDPDALFRAQQAAEELTKHELPPEGPKAATMDILLGNDAGELLLDLAAYLEDGHGVIGGKGKVTGEFTVNDEVGVRVQIGLKTYTVWVRRDA